MNIIRTLSIWFLLSSCVVVQAQLEKPSAATPKPAKTAYYVDSALLDVEVFLSEPPALDSAAAKEELAELHRIELARTPEQITKARADEGEEDMFVFTTVFGPGFTADTLPVTAALGTHVKNEQSVVGNQLKRYYRRPRPYQTDTTLHPVCGLKTEHDSYPSGHGMTGYLEAFTLAEIVPEKRTEILARADDYARSRLVCGLHYPSDTEASRRVAYVVFGYMLATPRFQRDLAAAREEMRAKLGLTGKKD